MSLTKPFIFINKQFGQQQPQYRWYQGIDIKFMENRNSKLYSQLIKMNCKAATGITIAACEWVLWRLCDWREQNSDLQKSYLQALWISLVSKEYLTKKEVKSILGRELSKIEEPIELINYNYYNLKYNYLVHHPYIYHIALNMLELARYISDDKEFFDNWFKTCLTKSIDLFPVPKDSLGKKGVFEYNDDEKFNPFSIKEAFIPREFYFEPDFDYQSADLKKLQANLLSSVDYNENPFLSSPERMKQIGFVGVPYQANIKE